jgi:hypothetical protein
MGDDESLIRLVLLSSTLVVPSLMLLYCYKFPVVAIESLNYICTANEINTKICVSLTSASSIVINRERGTQIQYNLDISNRTPWQN